MNSSHPSFTHGKNGEKTQASNLLSHHLGQGGKAGSVQQTGDTLVALPDQVGIDKTSCLLKIRLGKHITWALRLSFKGRAGLQPVRKKMLSRSRNIQRRFRVGVAIVIKVATSWTVVVLYIRMVAVSRRDFCYFLAGGGGLGSVWIGPLCITTSGKQQE